MNKRVAAIYGIGFITIVAMGYIPGFNIGGKLLGLYVIDPVDDVIHLIAGTSGALAAWHSESTATYYLRLAGLFFGLDALVGIFMGTGFLDTTLFTHGNMGSDFSMHNILINLPHVLIAGFALYRGFFWKPKMATKKRR